MHFTCFEEDLDGYLDWLRTYVDLANRSYARLESEPRITQEGRDAASAAHDEKKSARETVLRAKYPRKGADHSPKAEARAKRERRAKAEAEKRKSAR
ncbi:MAG: hypothetical protein ACYSU0_23515 [Planctomycetota bacterium]